MRMRVTFRNGVEPIEVTIPEGSKKKPYEIMVTEGSSLNRDRAFLGYVKDMDMCFMGVTNGADDDIESIELDDIPNMKKVRKANGEEILIGEGTDKDDESKYDTVIYDMASDTLIEKMYLTRNCNRTVDERVEIQRERERLSRGVMVENLMEDAQGNVINRGILVANKHNPYVNVPALIALTTKYIKGYQLCWDEELKKVLIKTDEGRQVPYDQIKQSGVYSYFKLIGLIMAKGQHTGVFYINTTPLSLDILEGMLKLIELVYGSNATVFLYGLKMKPKSDKIERHVVELPNYIRKGKKKA